MLDSSWEGYKLGGLGLVLVDRCQDVFMLTLDNKDGWSIYNDFSNVIFIFVKYLSCKYLYC